MLRALLKKLLNRIYYAEGVKYAEGLLKDGWSAQDLRTLPTLAPSLMPNGAYADGFADTLKRWEGA